MQYIKISIRGNGFYGYNALAYSIVGDKNSYEDIINDCLTVFYNHPDIFKRHTEFGCKDTNTVNDYETLMRTAIADIRAGNVLLHEKYQNTWYEEGHIIALSLLYDITVFVFDGRRKRWAVYNHEGRRGYCCLLSDYAGGHFEPLIGKLYEPLSGFVVSIPPIISQQAAREGYVRRMYNWNDTARNLLINKDYSLSNVFKWPVPGVP